MDQVVGQALATFRRIDLKIPRPNRAPDLEATAFAASASE
jgi:hypothetical protein